MISFRDIHGDLAAGPLAARWRRAGRVPTIVRGQIGQRLVTALICIAGLLVCLPSAASARTLVVTNNHDSGQSALRQGSLRQALVDAKDGDTIVVQPGIGVITLNPMQGPLFINKSITIVGAGAGQTVIDANRRSRVLDVEGSTNGNILVLPHVTISAVYITGGNPPTVNALAGGGGILVHDARLTLSDSIITRNRAFANTGGSSASAGYGGGIAVDTASGSLTLLNTIVADNQAVADNGGSGDGGNAQGGGIYDRGSLAIRGGAIEGNTADSSVGNASLFAEGGGVWYEGNTATIDGVLVRGNVAKGDSQGLGKNGGLAVGAGLYMYAGFGTTISNVTVTGNAVTATGGPNGNGGQAAGAGVLVGGTTPTTIVNTTVTGNTASANGRGTGKGGFADGAGLAGYTDATVLNTTIDANTSASTGPGGPGTVRGGNVYSGGKLRLKNSIVSAGAGAAGSENCFGGANIMSDGHNIDSLDQCDFHSAGDQVMTDPRLGSLADNGGPLLTQALLSGSPAIDAGDNSGCPSADARAVLRPAGRACDVGAFELATPGAVTGDASEVRNIRATLNGIARNPDLAAGKVTFQFGRTTAYGFSTHPRSVAPSAPGAHVSATVDGLAPNTTYHFRLVVTNPVGTSFGADRTFTTATLPSSPAQPPVALTGSPQPTRSQDGIKFTLRCRLRVRCLIIAVATTSEQLRGRRLVSVAQRRDPLRKRTVVVGRIALTIPAGQTRTITIKLNAAGQRLETKFRTLPVTLKITLIRRHGQKPFVKVTRLTIKPSDARNH
jgi:hypothetical protein